MCSVAQIAGVGERCVQIFIVELPARQVAEYGQLLPHPGQEAAWWEAIPPDRRKHIETIGN